MTHEEAMLLNMDQLTGQFVTIRQGIKEYETVVAELLKPAKERMEIIRAALQAKLQAMGANSVKTEHGTPYITKSATVKMENFEDFHAFVEEVQDSDFLVKSANKTRVEKWLEETGKLPPGVSLAYFQTCNVRGN